MRRPPQRSPLFPYTALFRSLHDGRRRKRRKTSYRLLAFPLFWRFLVQILFALDPRGNRPFSYAALSAFDMNPSGQIQIATDLAQSPGTQTSTNSMLLSKSRIPFQYRQFVPDRLRRGISSTIRCDLTE